MKLVEGQNVVYLKTGTEGRIVKIHELDGKIWAELDTTGLLYEENALEPKEPAKGVAAKKEKPKGQAGSGDMEKEMLMPDAEGEGKLDGSGTVGGGG